VWLGDTDRGRRHAYHLNRPIAMTDDTGAFVNETIWVAFGGIHVMTGSTGLDMRFPGQWYQHEGGLHYNWHRSYDPTIARYTQPDPLGPVDGPSRYAYVRSDPLQKVDPTGQLALLIPAIPGIVSGIAGGVTGVIAGAIIWPMIIPNESAEAARAAGICSATGGDDRDYCDKQYQEDQARCF
jgi:RHS repeat-associated protein